MIIIIQLLSDRRRHLECAQNYPLEGDVSANVLERVMEAARTVANGQIDSDNACTRTHAHRRCQSEYGDSTTGESCLFVSINVCVLTICVVHLATGDI